MAKLIITADNSYVEKLKKHLEKEHPSTKGKMKIMGDTKKRAFMTSLKDTLTNVGNITEKVLNQSTEPLSKMEKDLKKSMGKEW